MSSYSYGTCREIYSLSCCLVELSSLKLRNVFFSANMTNLDLPFPFAAWQLNKTYLCPHSASLMILFRLFTYPSLLTLAQTWHIYSTRLVTPHKSHTGFTSFFTRSHLYFPCFRLVNRPHTYNQLLLKGEGVLYTLILWPTIWLL